MFKKVLMGLQCALLVLGLILSYASGEAYWNIASSGIPKIADLKILHTTKANYARITATLRNTGTFMPRDKKDKDGPSYFYTTELEDKRIWVKSLHEREGSNSWEKAERLAKRVEAAESDLPISSHDPQNFAKLGTRKGAFGRVRRARP